MTGGPLGTGARAALEAPRLWPVALAGFLARGGIVLFALPIVALPSVVGLTTFIGPNSITAAGLAPRLVAMIGLTTAVLMIWITLATLVGAATDRLLIRAIVAARPASERPLRAPDRDLATLFVIRLVSLVPFALGVAIGGARLGQVAYQELVLPTDSSAPLVTRILAGAPEVVALLAATWLASELIGAVGVRLAMRDDRSALRSLAGALGWTVRHPVRSFGTLLATVLVSVVLIGPMIAVSIAAWASVRDLLLSDVRPSIGFLAVVLFVVSWLVGLLVAAVVATWRSAAWSLAVVEDHRGGGPVPPDGGTL